MSAGPVYPVNRLKTITHRGGSLHGTMMLELRLQGCDIQCEHCSVPETWMVDRREHAENLEDAMKRSSSWTELTSTEIMSALEELQNDQDSRIRWIKITGGEPTMYDLQWIILDLRCEGYSIALETSGHNVSALLCAVDHLIVSPLLEGQRITLRSVLSAADELRFVVQSNREMTLIDELLGPNAITCTDDIVLIPNRSKSKTDMKRARQICEHEARWRRWRVA